MKLKERIAEVREARREKRELRLKIKALKEEKAALEAGNAKLYTEKRYLRDLLEKSRFEAERLRGQLDYERKKFDKELRRWRGRALEAEYERYVMESQVNEGVGGPYGAGNTKEGADCDDI